MITKDEAIKAAETLKEWCGGKPCNNCPFGIKEDEGEYGCYFALGGLSGEVENSKSLPMDEN